MARSRQESTNDLRSFLDQLHRNSFAGDHVADEVLCFSGDSRNSSSCNSNSRRTGLESLCLADGCYVTTQRHAWCHKNLQFLADEGKHAEGTESSRVPSGSWMKKHTQRRVRRSLSLEGIIESLRGTIRKLKNTKATVPMAALVFVVSATCKFLGV